jgi:hypothetical protein
LKTTLTYDREKVDGSLCFRQAHAPDSALFSPIRHRKALLALSALVFLASKASAGLKLLPF